MREDTAAALGGDSAAAPGPEQAPAAPLPLLLPIEEAAVPAGPLAPGTRYVFTRDSILWESALTLSDLLANIPGVYVTRAGFINEPEYVQYAGRGSAGLEVFWDGVPWEPLGGDSLTVDPGWIPLTYLKRVDVEVLPAGLRVYLVSERHEAARVRSLVRVNSGAFKSAAYTALFQRRWAPGVSLDIAADYVGTDGPNQTAASSQFDVWTKVGWLPSPRLGAAFQVRRQQRDRNGLSAESGGLLVPARAGARSDQQFALFAATRDDGLGLRTDLGFGWSAWLPDSGSTVPEQRLRQAYASVRYRMPTWTLEVRGRTADRRTLGGAEARAGWVPIPWISVSGEAWWRSHGGDRTSRGVRASAGAWAGPVSLSGDVAWRDGVRAPALLADTAVATVDRAVRLALDTRWITGHVRVAQRDAFTPLAFTDLGIPALAESPAATYVEGAGVLRLSTGLSIAGWYSSPLADSIADFQPPTHGRVAVILRSKFWRTFRSGTFDLKVRYAIESWSTGTAGLGTGGSVIALPGATFHEMHLEIQLGDFTAFWDLKNARLSRAGYVPGFPFPLNAQTFGITWEFSN